MTNVAAKLRQLHAVIGRRKQRKRRIADLYRRAAIKTLSDLEKVLLRTPNGLPMTAQHFQNGGVDVTADQLADQIIERMRAVVEGKPVEGRAL